MKIPSFLLSLSRWNRRILLALASLLLLYTTLGFLVLPALIKAQLPPKLAQMLGRKVTLAKVRTNPFALSITLEGFQVLDHDSKPFLGWDRLYVNLGATSLFTQTLRLQDIELIRPYGRVIVMKNGKLNFSDIMERLGQDTPKVEPKTTTPPREIAIHHLVIQGAKVQLLDRSLSEPFTTELGPLTLELKDFQTARDRQNPYAFTGRTESGETFAWTGTFSTEPLSSQGKISFERLALPKYHPYYKDQVAFDLKDGLVSIQANYTFQWSAGIHALKVLDGTLDLQNLKLSEIGKTKNAVELPRLEIRGVQADLIARSAEINSLIAWDGKLDITHLKNGEISLMKLLKPKAKPEPLEPAQPFALRLKEFGTRNFTVNFEDLAPIRPVLLACEKIDITLQDFSLDPKGSTRLAAALVLNGHTQLKAEGSVSPFQPSMDLTIKLDGLELSPLDPYLAPALDVRVNRGQLSVDGRVRGTFVGNASDAITFMGNLRLQHFEAMDGAQQEPLLRYKELRLTGLDLGTNPRKLGVKSIELTEPDYRMVIAKDGTTNLSRALKTEVAVPVTPTEAVKEAIVPDRENDAFKVAVAKVQMQGGRVTFIDRSLEPNAAFLITDLEGINTGLSTETTGNASMHFKGKVGGLAPFSIQGHSMPLQRDQDTDITLRIQGAELSDFTPYTGKYLGYVVRKGKLDVDAHVQIKKRQLDAVVSTKMDQFYFGDRTQSPDATKLPVKLALAILRDRKGIISLELPMKGSLDDPEFFYGKIVWKALLNVLTKVVTSPFTLLGNLFGGAGEDLSFASFQPGTWEVDASAKKKAEVLAKSLIERPELSLELEGTADPVLDGAALKKMALERLLKIAKANSLRTKDLELDPETLVITAEERPRWLTVAFEKAFPAPKEANPKNRALAPPPGEMEQRLLGSLAVNGNALRELASKRTNALVLCLLADGKVDSSRIFKVEGGERAQKEGGSRVYFGLK